MFSTLTEQQQKRNDVVTQDIFYSETKNPSNYNNNKMRGQKMNLTDGGILYVHTITINQEK